jgi:hypothetical protein
LAIAPTAVYPAESRRAGAGRHRLGVLPTGLTQVRVQGDQAEQDDQPGAVDHLRAGHGRGAAGRRHQLVAQQQVRRLSAQNRNPFD